MGEEVLNGINVRETREYIEACERDPATAERNPTVVAKWLGGSRARVDFEKTNVFMGGDDDPSAMKMLLACLAACDVEVVATHAALLGLQFEDLEVEANGHFNVRRLFGLAGAGPGYDQIAYTVRLRAPLATDEQIARLKEACEH
ncbi:MAG TPA: OsmC family protein, partial [Thermoplasmata archaeon]|nr:OsmC family protein [Thermoplasmata archaeon]